MPNSTLGSIDTALQILQPNLSPGVLKTELSMLSSSNTHVSKQVLDYIYIMTWRYMLLQIF